MNNPTPNPNFVGDLFWGIFKPQWIRLALTLDIFTPLAASPFNAEQVAQACHCDSFPIQALLDYFCAVHILDKRGDLYALTPTAETFLVRGREAYAGDMILDYTSPALFESILNSIRTGKPRSLNENFVQDAWLESYSAWRIPKSLEMWKAAGITTERPLRILDIACGCAIKSFALAQTSPNVHVTCLDSPDVLEVASHLAGRMAVSAQAAFFPADLFSANLGAEGFDAVLVGQITHYLTAEQNRDLFRRIHSALTEHGTLVIDCPMSKETPTESSAFLTLFLWANGGGTAHSFEMYKSWLEEIGFQTVTQLSERWLSAQK
ncbi:MAG: 3-hydroxy-5-methyl-1-naphthoate 3-O-methyltransferase [Anaerolineales bacterium]|nr:3-hydroxy-5-methyl-1-naphthoate 3-O-methyltransferase [Anaerolineales bacterium]